VTQIDRIIMWIDRHGSITALDAMREFGVMRLASRINDMRADGMEIESTLETGLNSFGEKVKYSRYKWAQ